MKKWPHDRQTGCHPTSILKAHEWSAPLNTVHQPLHQRRERKEMVETTERRWRGPLAVMLIVGVALLALTLNADPAQAHPNQYLPYHSQGPAVCDDYNNRVLAYPPKDMRGYYDQAERGWWSPDLYRYTSSGWRIYDGTKPWYAASVNRYGIIQTPTWAGPFNWYLPSNFSGLKFVPFNNLPPGLYSVKQFYDWDNSPYAAHQEWQTFGDGSQQCRIY